VVRLRRISSQCCPAPAPAGGAGGSAGSAAGSTRGSAGGSAGGSMVSTSAQSYQRSPLQPRPAESRCHERFGSRAARSIAARGPIPVVI
jgi:hypothetical protein